MRIKKRGSESIVPLRGGLWKGNKNYPQNSGSQTERAGGKRGEKKVKKFHFFRPIGERRQAKGGGAKNIKKKRAKLSSHEMG